MNETSMSWGEIANLTHETQVSNFGWCWCEDNEGNQNPYDDCPSSDLIHESNITSKTVDN